MAMRKVRRMDVRVLGPLRVLANGRELQLGGRKAKIILAMLVVHRRRVVSAASMANAIWDARPPATYATSLQVSVSGLRRVLRDAGFPDVLRTVSPGYLLDLDETDCDVGRFEVARTAAAVTPDPAQAATHLRSALAQWDGEVLADLRGLSFADTFAAALDEERWHTVAARIEADIAAGGAAKVIGELVTLTTEYPLREPFWVQLVTALYVAGRQSDALDACRRVRGILSDELGVDPGPKLLQLEQIVLRQEPLAVVTASVKRPGDITITEALEIIGVQSGRILLPDGRTVVASGRLRIGRAPDNDIPLKDSTVSRYHARIIADERGLMLRDLESTNGVYLSDKRIEGDALLFDGAEIRIGSTRMVFEQT